MGEQEMKCQARQCSAAVDEQLERQNRELTILYQVSEALNRSTDVHTALEQTLILIAEWLGLHSGWVWLLDAEERPYLAASLKLPPFLQRPAQMEGWLCLCLQTFVEGDLAGAANLNVLECSRLKKARSGSEGLRFHASIPLYLDKKKLGVMNVAGPEWRKLSPEDLMLLSTIGNHVAVAVERARLAEESARIARLQERNRLAREIHDTLAQELGAISLYLESVDALLPSNPQKAGEQVRRALDLTREALGEARHSVQDLRASILEGRTLGEALHNLTTQFTHRTGIETHLEIRAHNHNLPSQVEAELYRIAQEALSNVHKHAEAHCVRIQLLEQEHDQLILQIQDDGKGFPRSTDEKHTSFGLLGMYERAEMLGGTLSVRSLQQSEEHGTVVFVRVPLSAAPAN
jgi:two-component system, NarL family, sensor kinase